MEFAAHTLTFFFIFALAAIGLAFCVHAGGIINLGLSAFFGIGAYTAGLMAIHFETNYAATLLLGGLAAAISATLLALLTDRLRADYFAIASLGFLELTRQLIYNWESVTNGAYGLANIPPAAILGYRLPSPSGYLMGAAGCFMIGVLILKYIQSDLLGLRILAIKANTAAAELLGHRPLPYKASAVYLSAFFAGISGAQYSSYVNYLHPNEFGVSQSLTLLAVAMLATERSLITGSLLGLFVYFILSETLRTFELFGSSKAQIIQIATAVCIFIVVFQRRHRSDAGGK